MIYSSSFCFCYYQIISWQNPNNQLQPNSNFGNKALVSKGFKPNAFNRDDTGYVTHIVPPKDLKKRNKYCLEIVRSTLVLHRQQIKH